MKRDHTTDKPLVFEALEPRLLLDGDVTFSVIKDLVLIGDAADNAVLIEPAGPNIIRVTGVGGTTINGGADATAGWFGGIVAIMSLGNNNIEINGVECNRNITIETGPGNDTIDLEDTVVHGKTSIGTGGGADNVTIDPCTFNGKFTLVTGDGDDDIDVETSIPSTVFNGKATFNTGAGNDRIDLNTTTLNGKVKASFGDGLDWLYVGDCTVNSGFSADMGKSAESDRFEAHDTTWFSKLSVKMGAGVDVVMIESDFAATFHGAVKIDTGAAVDTVTIADETFNGKFSLKTGDGDDIVQLSDTEIAGAVKLDGGNGANDAYQDAGGISLTGAGTLTFKGFEIFV